MKELEILLERYWISKEEDKELYYRIKDAYPNLKGFLQDRLGYRLIINPYLIKLEKLPGEPESWMGIEEFTDKLEYAFLCLLLTFLEDKGAEEQFILSQVTDFIEAIFPQDRDIQLDWTLYNHRRHLVKVMRFAEDLFFIKTNNGTDSNFMSSATEEVLYENTGLSKYFMLNFTGNISNYSSYQDIEKGEWLDLDRDRGRVRRNRVYRRLFMSPVVYNQGVDDADYLYIKNYRNMLKKDVEDMLDSELHVHKNGAFISLDESKYFKDVFPDNKSISDIILQLNGIIREMLEEGEISKKEDDIITISQLKFDNMVADCRQRYHSGWSKGFREMSIEKLVDEIKSYMKNYSMLEINDRRKELTVLPLAGKIIGKYPDDFKNEGGK